MLAGELEARSTRLRPPEVVMEPRRYGSARLTRYSFNRTMLRRAVADGWTARRVSLDIDAEGRGEAIYEVVADGVPFSFVAFLTTLDESEHTDRVIAERWEICGALVEGELTDELMAMCRSEIPAQESGRVDPRVLVLTRGNRSVRFFDYLVQCLADGNQPDPDLVADSGYIMRSTAFYGNGKYGMRSFSGYADDHPLRVPYRAQFVCAWMFRELSYDVVESCAFARGDAAVPFDDQWRRFFGLGNATGLGLVPYAFKHPAVVNAWVAVREIALADVRAMSRTDDLVQRLAIWIQRARTHYETGTDDDCSPFFSAAQLVPVVAAISAQFEALRDRDDLLDALYLWAEEQGPETSELVVSLLVELHDGDDDLFDDLLRAEEHHVVDPAMTLGELLRMIEERFSWLGDLDLDNASADGNWWVISDNTEEPRRVPKSEIEPAGRDVAIDFALRIHRLSRSAQARPADQTITELLAAEPEHRLGVERVVASIDPYGEPRDNRCSPEYLPLLVQRFQLAMYGMDNFKPKSTDWLRVTLFQGAPRLDDLAAGPSDDWVLPARPLTVADRGAAT